MKLKTLALAAILLTASAAQASTAYTNEASFQSALTGGVTLVNLDAPPLSAFASGYHVEDAGPAASFAGFGLNFTLVNAFVLSGQDHQIAKPGRDRLLLNGDAFYGNSVNSGNLAFDFLAPVHGIGMLTNNRDVGRIRAFTGAGLSGTLIGEADIVVGGFGGLVSDVAIGSVEVLCEWEDHACGVYDLQFGRLAMVPNPVPEPQTYALMLAGLGVMVLLARRRQYR
jgi:hypothetical protein